MAPRPTSEVNDWQAVQHDPGDWNTVTDWQDAGPKPEAIQQPKGSAAARAAGGAWDNTVGGLGKAIKTLYHISSSSPGGIPNLDAIQDMHDLVQSHIDQAKKAKEAWGQGEHVEAIGHGMAAALPLVGPAAAHAGERIGGTVPEFDKYGSVVTPGQAPDVAGGLGEAAGLIATSVAPSALRAVAKSKPVMAAGEAIQGAAERQYGRVLGATTKPNKVRSGEVIKGYDAPVASSPGTNVRVPGLLDRGTTAFTRKGLAAKATDTVRDLGQRLEAEWSNIPPDQGVPAADVYKTLDTQLQGEFLRPSPSGGMLPTGPHGAGGLAFGQSLKNYLKGHEITDASGKQIIPYDSIRKFRQDWDTLVASKNGYAGADLANQANTSAYKVSANGLRNILNSGNPTIEAINREFSFWKDASRVIDDTNLRTSTQAKPLGRKLARVAGQAVGYGQAGPVGAVLGGEAMDALEATISSPAWQTVSAVNKARLADAIATGSAAQVMGAIGEIQRGGAAVGDNPGLRATFPAEHLIEFAALNGLSPSSARAALQTQGYRIREQ